MRMNIPLLLPGFPWKAAFALAAALLASRTAVAANRAPVLDSSYSPALTAIREDDRDSPGDRVGDIVVDGSTADADGGAPESIAVTAVDNTRGRWQYFALDEGHAFAQAVDGDGFTPRKGQSKAVAVSPDGRHVYVTDINSDSVTAFRRDGITGELTYIESKSRYGPEGIFGLGDPYGIAVSPDGRHVFAVGADDDAVVAFKRNPATGTLAFADRIRNGEDGVTGFQVPEKIAVSPDGRYLYITNEFLNRLTVIAFNDSTGELTFAGSVTDGADGVDGLYRVKHAEISPDGMHLYAAGYWDNAVAVFARNCATGALAFVEQKKQGQGGVNGVTGAQGIALSPDGRFLYTASESALAVFSRDGTAGTLSYLEHYNAYTGDLAGLGNFTHIAVSPDGQFVYISTIDITTGNILVFTRDPLTGSLRLKSTLDMGSNHNADQFSPFAIAVSPDGRNIYASNYLEHSFISDIITLVFTREGGFTDFTGVRGARADLSASARLLSESRRVRFVPDPDFHGPSSFEFRAWDRSAGGLLGEADATVNGGETPFSFSADTARIVVEPVYDLAGVKHPTDFDRDGRPDMLWWNTAGGNLVGHFLDPADPSRVRSAFSVKPNVPDQEFRLAGLADFDGDEKLDILWQKTGNGDIVAWRLQGPMGNEFDIGTDAALLVRGPGPAWDAVSFGDLNGDGHQDIIWQRKSDFVLIGWLMDGRGNVTDSGFPVMTNAALGAQLKANRWTLAGAADFTNNGTLDLLWRDTAGGALMAWEDRDPSQTVPVDRLPPAEWVPAGFDDWNGDGRTDIVWWNQVDGKVVVNFYRGTANSRFGAMRIGLALPPSTNWRPVGSN